MNMQPDGAIVVGVAESVFNGWALRWAAEQARLEGRALTLANAAGPVAGTWSEHGMDALPHSSEMLREHGEALLARAREVVEKAAPEVEIREVFEIIDPTTLLTQLSTTAHLLVLGSRGRGPVRSHLLGSVGLAVVRHASCPVVVHRPGDQPGSVHRGVVVAADATEQSRPVLAFAFREASLRRLPLKAVHYVYDVRSTLVGAPLSSIMSEDTEQHEVALSESLAGLREDFPDVPVSVDMLPGLLPEQGLTELSQNADLLVVGTHHRGILSRMLGGSVSQAVLEHASGPVAVVPTSWVDD
jgi:nucleotide-binding universal stress UspA family protein